MMNTNQRAADPALLRMKNRMAVEWFRLWRRRQFLIDPRAQLKAAFGITILVGPMVVLLGFMVVMNSQISSMIIVQEHPGLRSHLGYQDGIARIGILVGSVVLVAGVFLMVIFQSHKTAGAAFSLQRSMKCLGEGDYTVTARLREDDNLQNLGDAFNTMAENIRSETQDDLRTLAEVLDRLRQTGSESSSLKEIERLIERKEARLRSSGSAG